MYCQQCGRPLPDNEINKNTLTAVCQYCYGVSDFKPPEKNNATEPHISLRNIKIEKNENQLKIEYRWRSAGGFDFALFFAGFLWTAFFICGFMSPHYLDKAGFIAANIMMHMGTIMMYRALVLIFNKTIFEIDKKYVSIKHGPLPWPGGRIITSSDISQIYCKKDKIRSGKSPLFALKAILKKGGEVPLLLWQDSPEISFCVKHEIEMFLNIKDSSFPGELQGV